MKGGSALATARLTTPPCSVSRSVNHDIGCKLRSLCNRSTDPMIVDNPLLLSNIAQQSRPNRRRQTLRSPQCLPAILDCSVYF